MRTDYLVVGTKPHVHSFIRRLFIRRLCIAEMMTVLNAVVLESQFLSDAPPSFSPVWHGLLIVLLCALVGTLAHVWLHTLRTLAFYEAIVEIPSTDFTESPKGKGETSCSSA